MRGVRLRLQQLSKRFGRVVAVHALDLEVDPGELMAFLGPSGCGKTTTLLMIAGIYRPTTGAIYFDDRRVDHLPPRDRDVGMVFQSYALYPHLTLFENIAFPLRLKRFSEREVAARVRRMAELLGIETVLDRYPSQVSGGQQQRAALARALVKEPQILLLDEPLSNLDAQIRVQARAEIRRIQQELGVTTILVTHDQAEALAMADRVAVFSMGQLLQVAPPEELYQRPATAFVAGFVGNPPMNLLKGQFADSEFVVGRLRLSLPVRVPPGTGYLGVRPEDVHLQGHIPGRVVVVESLGRQALVTVDLDGIELKVLVSQADRPVVGGKVSVGWELNRVHLFDAAGARIGP